MNKVRVGVLVSGRGSNMMALVEAARPPGYPAEIVCVVSNRADAAGLDFASANGIESKVIDHKAFASREAFERALDSYLRSKRVDIIACAGFIAAAAGSPAATPGKASPISPSAFSWLGSTPC